MNLKENATILVEGFVQFGPDEYVFEDGSKKGSFKLSYDVWGKNSSINKNIIRCEVFEELLHELEVSTLSEYLRKGDRLQVTGQLVIDNVTDESGKFISYPKIRVRKIIKI